MKLASHKDKELMILKVVLDLRPLNSIPRYAFYLCIDSLQKHANVLSDVAFTKEDKDYIVNEAVTMLKKAKGNDSEIGYGY